jgi:DNA-binding beta-propeller fold protein YncE
MLMRLAKPWYRRPGPAVAALVLLAAGLLSTWMALRANTPTPRPSVAVAAAARPAFRPATRPPFKTLGRVTSGGVSVEFRARHLDSARAADEALREGDNVAFSFKVVDLSTGSASTGANPAAWIVPGSPGEASDDRLCTKKAASLISGDLFNRSTVDFNVYYVITLHDDSIAVYDPLFSFGGTKLLAQVPLGGQAGDWRLSPDGGRLFVSLPASGRVVVIDTKSWEQVKVLETGRASGRLGVQPDGHYLWVADGAGPPEGGPSGVTVIDVELLRVVAHVDTGRGRHALAFDDDSTRAFVTNFESGTVSIIDVRSLRKVFECATGQRPVSVDGSAKSGWAYVAHEGDGVVTAIDGQTGSVAARLTLAPGLGHLRIAPGGRYGLVLNSARKELSVFDVSTHRVVQHAAFRSEPGRVAFSETMAYVVHGDSLAVSLIPLAQIGAEGRPLPVSEIPVGRNALGRVGPADTVVQAPGEAAVLIAHPSDRAVYFHREGMNAPTGTFKVSTGEPRAVLALDRGLRERSEPGDYEAVATLPLPGDFDVVFFNRSPRVVHCFPLKVDVDPARARTRTEGRVDFDWIGPVGGINAGREVALRFRLRDPLDGAPRKDLAKVGLVVMLSPGVWHERATAVHQGDGVFERAFAPPEPGVYYVYLHDPAARVVGAERPLRVLHAGP